MRKSIVAMILGVLTLPLWATAETWKDVSMVDTNCVAKVKADPDAHPRSCALQCQKSGYGILTSDGSYLKFDDAGNKKAVDALNSSKKADHIRVTVTGERSGDTIKVEVLKM